MSIHNKIHDIKSARYNQIWLAFIFMGVGPNYKSTLLAFLRCKNSVIVLLKPAVMGPITGLAKLQKATKYRPCDEFLFKHGDKISLWQNPPSNATVFRNQPYVYKFHMLDST